MTRQTAGALQFYAVGLVSYAVLKVLTPAFYAVGKRNTPMVVSFLAIGTNLFLNWLFTFRLGWGHRGLGVLYKSGRNDQFSFALRTDVAAHTQTGNTPVIRRARKICVAGVLLALGLLGGELLLARFMGAFAIFKKLCCSSRCDRC